MNKIEKQFFETFGIPPLCCKKYLTNCMIYDCENCENFDSTFSTYPKITDRILLELICLITQIELYDYSENDYYTSFNYKDLKQEIISKANRLGSNKAILETTGESFKSKIQELFKENN